MLACIMVLEVMTSKIQAMKMFTQGGSGGGGQSQLISLAMSEATKLFNSSGKSSDSEKQETVNSAAMTMMKLVVQVSTASLSIEMRLMPSSPSLVALGYLAAVTKVAVA